MFFKKRDEAPLDLAALTAFAGEDEPSELEPLLQRLAVIDDKVDRLHEALLPSGAAAEAQVAALLFDRLVLPTCEDLMAYFDRLQQVLAPIRRGQPALDDSLRDSLLGLDDEILEILQRQGIEPVTSRTLDPALHQVRARVPVDRPELDKQIARSHRCGFRRGEALLRREEVDIYRYNA